MLEVGNLQVRYSGIQALRGVSLAVGAGEVVALIGPNGAGKSTLVNAVSGLVAPAAGRIALEGRDLAAMTPWDIAALGVLQVPEGRQVFPQLTVRENLQLGATALRGRGGQGPQGGLDQVHELFPILAERAAQLAGSLSGGQQQMLAIGRALMGRPRMLLLDEPSLGLAPVVIAQVFAALRTLKARGMTILLIEQNAHLALELSDRAYILDQGRVVLSGDSRDLAAKDDVVAHYLGVMSGVIDRERTISTREEKTMKRFGKLTGATMLAATLATMLAPVLVPAGTARADEVKIAAILSTTGTYAFVGVPLVNGIRMADEQLKADGRYGPHTVVMTYDDNRSDRQEAISLLTRRSQTDKADLILGPISSAEAMATGPVAVQLGVPMFTVAMTNEVLPLGQWIFKSTETANTYMPPLANYIGGTLKPKNCYLISILDNPGYIIQKDVFRDTLKKHGVAILADEGILATDTDFTALSTKIVDADPKCLFVTTPPQQAANIILQARQAGLSPDTIVSGDTGLGSVQFINAAGAAGDGTLFPAIFVADYSDATRDFAKRYQAKYNVAPDHWAATGYSMMQIIAAALSRIKGDVTRENLREALTATKDVPVLMGAGNMTFGDGRVPTHGSIVMRVKGGTWEAVR